MKLYNLNLSVKFNLIVISLVVVTALSITSYLLKHEWNNRIESLTSIGISTSNMIAKFSHYAFYSEDEDSLATIMGMLNDEDSVTYIGLLRPNTTILKEKWHKNNVELKRNFPTVVLSSIQSLKYLGGNEYISIITPVTIASASNLDLSPLEHDNQTETAKIELLGYVHLILNTKNMQQLAKKSIESVIYMVSTIVVITILVTITLTKPIRRLVNATQLIANGEFTHKLELIHGDEFNALASNFNDLSDRLNDSSLKLKEQQRQLANQRIAEKTKELHYQKNMAEAANKAKSDFLATMSHEIRTPLNGILGMAELLSETTLDDRQQHFVTTILSSGDSLLAIINDILDFTKIEAGKLMIESIEFDLRILIENICELMAERAQEKGLNIHMLLPLTAKILVIGDELRIRQVLLNLLSNAIKFTKAGDITLRVIKTKTQNKMDDYRIEVIDTGIGISELKQQEIFNPFSQADNTITRCFGGTGLGLSISQKLVTLMSGTLALKSQLGEGTVFSFTLPMMSALYNDDVLQHSRSIKGKAVLLIDENEISGHLLVEQMQAWQLHPQWVKRLPGTAQMLQQYDYVIIDECFYQQYPEQFERFLTHQHEQKNLSLIMLCNIASCSKLTQIIGHSHRSILAKPVRQSALLSRLLGWELVIASKKTQQKLYQYTVLLAEDNEVNQEIATLMLNSLGCNVVVAADGIEAFQAFSKQSFDIIFMDFHMPIMDGINSTKKIRELERFNGVAKPIPIIALTADVKKGMKEQCIEAGMNDYATKPVTKSQLQQKLILWGEPNRLSSTPSGASTPATMDGFSAALDVTQLDAIAAMQQPDMPNILHKVIRLYLSESTQLMNKIKLGIEQQNATIIMEAAHSLKSSSLNLGANKLGAYFKQLEMLADSKQIEAASNLLNDLIPEYDFICAELQKVLSSKVVRKS